MPRETVYNNRLELGFTKSLILTSSLFCFFFFFTAINCWENSTTVVSSHLCPHRHLQRTANMTHQIYKATVNHAEHTGLALQAMGEASPTLAHIQIFQPSWNIWEILSQFFFPSIFLRYCLLQTRVLLLRQCCIFPSHLDAGGIKTILEQIAMMFPSLLLSTTLVSFLSSDSSLSTLLVLIPIHVTFKKMTKADECFHNPAKPHSLLQPPS